MFSSLIPVFFYLSSFSQFNKESEAFLYAKIDSLKKIAPKLNGKEKIDCLNTIVDQYQIMDEDNQMQIDSAGPYATQSFNEAKRIGYKRGLGYACLKLSYMGFLKAGIYKKKNSEYEPGSLNLIRQQINQAMKIAAELKDNSMTGSAYTFLAWLEKGNHEQRVNNLKKGITLIESDIAKQPKGSYKEMNYTNCRECTGQEFRLGELYSWLSGLQTNVNEALEALKKANEYYKKAEASLAVVNTYIAIVSSYFTAGNTENGNEILKELFDYFPTDKNENDALILYRRLSSFFWGVGDFENGLEYSRRNINLVEKLQKNNTTPNINNIEWGQAYFWMGRFYRIAGDNETAVRYMKKARTYYPSDIKSINELCAIEIGKAYSKLGNYDSAMFYLGPFANNKMASTGAKAYLGELYISMGQFDKALPLIKECIDIETENSSIANLTGLYTNAAKIFLGKENYQTALYNARKSIGLLNKYKRNIILIETYFVLSNIFEKLGYHDSAYIYLKKHSSLKDSLFNKQLYIRLNDLKKEAEEERKTSQINLLNKDNQLKEQKLKQQATLKNSLIAGILLLFLLGLFIFTSLLLKRKNERLRMQKDFELRHLENEKKQAELEMQALRAQMNPHFIFNCLSSINRFILKNESKIASNYLTRFSRLMRMVLNNSQKPLISLDDELEMLELYLEMERLRFKNSFDYGITFLNTVDSDNIFIPPLLLQPFCENAIWHGLMNKEGQGRLDIELSLENNILSCVIRDNGVGRGKAEELKSKTAEKEKSMGLKITTERLALLNREKGVQTFYDIEDLKDESGNATGTKVNLKLSFKQSVEELV